MKIEGKSIRSLTKVLKLAGDAKRVRLVFPLNEIEEHTLEALGFNKNPDIGDFLIPSKIGKYTAFNADGDVHIRKDLPKQPESIMYYGASRDWHGGIHYGIKTRTVDKYPRDHIPAPSETLQIIELSGSRYVSTAELELTDDDKARNIHACNLMLECFSSFNIVNSDTSELIGPKLKRLQWEILPKGEYPWEKSKSIIQKATESLKEGDQKIIEHRMKILSRRNPDFLATGRGGFSGYFVYGFKDKNVYVLESIYLDNATYVFSSEWEELSQLTKREIIQGKLPHQRIVHNHKWNGAIGRAIDGK